MIFDNTKIRRLVPSFRAEIPFSEGVRQIISWYDAAPERRVFDPNLDRLFDELVQARRRAMPEP
jgi:hypothetical protein